MSDETFVLVWTVVSIAVVVPLVIGLARLIDATERVGGKTSARVVEAAISIVVLAAIFITARILR